MSIRKVLQALFALVAITTQAQTFTNTTPTSLLFNHPLLTAVADFNHDGRADFVSLGYQGGGSTTPLLLEIHLGAGDGTFTSLRDATATLDSCDNPTGMSVSSLDASGSLNILVVCYQSLQLWHVVSTSNGAIALSNDISNRQVVALDQQGFAMALGDFTGLGSPGAAVIENIGAARSVVYYPPAVCSTNCTSPASFIPFSGASIAFDLSTVVPAGQIATAITSFALQGSAFPGIAVATETLGTCGGSVVPLVYNATTNKFVASPIIKIQPSYCPAAIASADFDNNGTADLVIGGSVLNGSNNPIYGFVTTLLGVGDGTFTIKRPGTSGALPFDSNAQVINSYQNLAVADMNGDGNTDVLVGGPEPSGYTQKADQVAIYPGDGTANFGPSTLAGPDVSQGGPSGLGGGIASIAAANINTDGAPDIVAVDYIEPYFNGTFTATPGSSLQTFTGRAGDTPILQLAGTSGNKGATLTATLSGTAPTGYIQFFDATAQAWIGSAKLTNGVASFVVSGTGQRRYIASYYGDTHYTGSSSNVTAVVLSVVPIVTTTTLTSTSTNPVQGSSLTFTATVTGTSGTPTGTVTFLDGATALGSPVTLDANSKATYSTSTLSVGAHNITASYSGASTFAVSVSSVTTVTVKAPSVTTTALTATSLTPVVGDSVTFTAKVTSTDPGTATGTVTFNDGATALGTGTLSAGTATCSTTTLAAGAHTITASYGGDASFASSLSSSLSVTVSGTTTTTLTANPTSVVYGTAVPITAKVTSTAAGTPTGIVTFKEGATILGTGTLDATAATIYSAATLSVGTHNITATYAGDSKFTTSTAAAFVITITAPSTTTSLTASSITPLLGASVTLTAKITSTATGTPTGTVTFKDGTTTLGTGTLSAGTATYTTTTLAAGAHTITAIYAGDAIFTASTSAALTVTVSTTAPDFTITVNPATLTIKQGSTSTATFTVTPTGGFTGVINFSCPGLPVGATCTFAPPTLTADGTNKVLTSVLTLSTTAPRALHSTQASLGWNKTFGLLPALAFGFFLTRRRRKSPLTPLLMALFALTLTLGLSGCADEGATNPNATPAGTYPLSISAGVTGGTAHTVALSVTVTP